VAELLQRDQGGVWAESGHHGVFGLQLLRQRSGGALPEQLQQPLQGLVALEAAVQAGKGVAVVAHHGAAGGAQVDQLPRGSLLLLRLWWRAVDGLREHADAGQQRVALRPRHRLQQRCGHCDTRAEKERETERRWDEVMGR
jgi:hypothetical protein